MALQGIGAPFLIGLGASVIYFFDIRRQVANAHISHRPSVERVA